MKKTTRVRRTHSELFLDKLEELSGNESKFVSNKTMREALEWDETRYNRIKGELVNEAAIVLGRGYGGSVALASKPGTQALKVFVSYSHVDEDLKTDLLKHLEPLRRAGLIEAWHDRKIKAGEEWDKKISGELQKADIILLLISIDFINSQYCYDIELERALERHDQGEAVVIPVILRNCLWKTSPFSKLQALPKDAKAVTAWSDRDEAFVNIVEGIRVVAQRRLSGEP